ncbi:MAG: hypothetical protein M5U31_13970 [Acidimicrobiia bacterium]|nr:hypothetical protein [Acidimicrobiia bacterium]
MPSFAYLDGGSASVLLGGVLAIFAGIAVFARMIWHKIRHPFGGGASDADADANDEDVHLTDDSEDTDSVPSVDQA